MLPVSDDGRVQVAIAVNLGAADEAQVHLACSQQSHHVQCACSPGCPGTIWSVAHRIEQLLRRLITHNTDLEKPYTGGRVGTLRQGKRNQREAHAYKDIFAIVYLPRCTGNHQFSGCIIHNAPPFTSAESRAHFGNKRRSPPISPDAVRAYTAIQRTQATQMTQMTQMTQTSLKTH